jgi:hypothetical protein
MFGRILISLGLILVGSSFALAESDLRATDRSGLRGMFWDGVAAVHVILKGIGSLAGGPERGEIWQFDIETHTRSRVGSGDTFAWPVLGPDRQVIFALKGTQVVKVEVSDRHETNLGPEAAWRKLIGVGPDETILGLIGRSETAQPALLTSNGKLSILPAASTDREKEDIALLLQEDRLYSGNRRLDVARSKRGGRGYDVYYATNGNIVNVSDCGDDKCGQPALS